MPQKRKIISTILVMLVFLLFPDLDATSGEADLTSLPVGDGKISNQPEVGSVWSCNTSFDGRGAKGTGDWMNGDGTFNFLAKPVVEGEVYWPSELTISVEGETRVVTGNMLPETPTGEYPIGRNTEAYKHDGNPNSIKAQEMKIKLPLVPELASKPSCLGLGPIGVMVTGSAFFNSLDAVGRDAVAHEIQDSCQGHPERSGTYHFHSLSLCQEGTEGGDDHSPLVGYALDGFGIFGHLGEAGKVLTNADLDACHGHSHAIEWDGNERTLYHYHATWEYPYTVGCFMGTPATLEGFRENNNPNKNKRR